VPPAPAGPAFDRVKRELLADADADVTETPEGLAVKGVLFAYESEAGRLVVDLPAARAADLVTRGIAEREAGDRPARGAWVEVADADDWLELATEAHQFVGEPAVGRDS
jgi:hypothetical protein